MQGLLAVADLGTERSAAVQQRAADWVRRVRTLRDDRSPLDAFLQQYDLSTQEGVLLMCIAEALLRIPDADTADRLIRDKLARGDWERHLGKSRLAAGQRVDLGADADRAAACGVDGRRRARLRGAATAGSSRASASRWSRLAHHARR